MPWQSVRRSTTTIVKHHNRTIYLRCETCDADVAVECQGTVDIPANLWGPPESCDPGEDGEFEIVSGGACNACGREVDEFMAQSKFQELLKSDRYES